MKIYTFNQVRKSLEPICNQLPIAKYSDEVIISWWNRHGKIDEDLLERIRILKHGTNGKRTLYYSGLATTDGVR